MDRHTVIVVSALLACAFAETPPVNAGTSDTTGFDAKFHEMLGKCEVVSAGWPLNRFRIRYGSYQFHKCVDRSEPGDQRGLYVVAIHGNEVVLESFYNTSGNASANQAFLADMEKLQDGTFVMVAVYDDAARRFNSTGLDALRMIGGGTVDLSAAGTPPLLASYSYLCIGYKGMAEGRAVEKVGKHEIRHPNYYLPQFISNLDFERYIRARITADDIDRDGRGGDRRFLCDLYGHDESDEAHEKYTLDPGVFAPRPRTIGFDKNARAMSILRAIGYCIDSDHYPSDRVYHTQPLVQDGVRLKAFNLTPGVHDGLWIDDIEVLYYIPPGFDPETANPDDYEYVMGIHGAAWGRPGAAHQIANMREFTKSAEGKSPILIAPVISHQKNLDSLYKKELSRREDSRFLSPWRDCPLHSRYWNRRWGYAYFQVVRTILETFHETLFDEPLVQSGVVVKPMYLMGHSGGGQWVPRFAMMNPEYVKALGISAPGTLPFRRYAEDPDDGVITYDFWYTFHPGSLIHQNHRIDLFDLQGITRTEIDRRISSFHASTEVYIVFGDLDATTVCLDERGYEIHAFQDVFDVDVYEDLIHRHGLRDYRIGYDQDDAQAMDTDLFIDGLTDPAQIARWEFEDRITPKNNIKRIDRRQFDARIRAAITDADDERFLMDQYDYKAGVYTLKKGQPAGRSDRQRFYRILQDIDYFHRQCQRGTARRCIHFYYELCKYEEEFRPEAPDFKSIHLVPMRGIGHDSARCPKECMKQFGFTSSTKDDN